MTARRNLPSLESLKSDRDGAALAALTERMYLRRYPFLRGLLDGHLLAARQRLREANYELQFYLQRMVGRRPRRRTVKVWTREERR